MHSEQNVCEQLVMTGVWKKSLQTWQRNAASTAASAESDVDSQSVESGTSSPVMVLVIGSNDDVFLFANTGNKGPDDSSIVA
jgi:hypothetical protein